MQLKFPPLLAVAVVGLLWIVLYLSVAERAPEQQTAHNLEIERSVLRAIDRECAPWKSDSAQFADCGEAFRVYEKCEVARPRMLDREGESRISDAGVVCEHPVYKFHEREQAEFEQVERGSAQRQ
ncbi:MAG TPA: hypothetical protein VK803_04320 [Steroidobacteraceae bacterium]|jgi:hypothetical protein|nr:hypothetical protein [Steroidobacteraceae bacterium]